MTREEYMLLGPAEVIRQLEATERDRDTWRDWGLAAAERAKDDRTYAVALQSLLIEAREIVHVFNPFDPLKGRIDAALAKNPNPIGQLAAEASVCLATLEASRAGGAGTVSACHEIGTGCAHEWISADHPPQITGMIICRKCKEIRAAGHESDAPVPVLAVGQRNEWTCDGCKGTFAAPVNGLCPECGCNLIDKAAHDPADPLYWKSPRGPQSENSQVPKQEPTT